VRLDTLRSIEAPEGVELALRVASPWPRALAWAIDVAMILAMLWVIGIGLAMLGSTGNGLMLIVWFLLNWGWDVAWEVLGHGATPGKRALGLTVTSDDGTPVGWTRSLLRNLLRTADWIPGTYAFGLASCLASRDFKRLGDRVAGTLVVHRERRGGREVLPKAPAVAPPVALTTDEQAALLEFASRARAWTPERRAEIADRLEPLTGAKGDEGVARVLGMALWIEGAR
jgi:uncharacterized RDD family membrane protein YckC